ncbi:MAG: four helix bundle protein [Bacteroidetes bacterium]|nr:four helix bundle protein [Bacteroidota bacterium]
MSETNRKEYDLELRTLKFAKEVRDFCMALKKDVINSVYIKQLIRSSSSIGANYLEANDNLGEKDLMMRVRISRKEAKETKYWIELIITETEDIEIKRKQLFTEANELMLILGAILKKLTLKTKI